MALGKTKQSKEAQCCLRNCLHPWQMKIWQNMTCLFLILALTMFNFFFFYYFYCSALRYSGFLCKRKSLEMIEISIYILSWPLSAWLLSSCSWRKCMHDKSNFHMQLWPCTKTKSMRMTFKNLAFSCTASICLWHHWREISHAETIF